MRFFGKSILVMTSRPPVQTGGEAGQPLGAGVFGQFSLAGNGVATLHLATCVFLAGNHVSEEQLGKD